MPNTLLYPRECSRFSLRLVAILALLLGALSLSSCKHAGASGAGEVMYVSSPQAYLRDRVATIYNRVGTVKNGDRVVVLDHQKRFVRVRTDDKQEGWIELRALVSRETFEQFEQLANENRNTPVQGRGVTRVELNMHIGPGRDADTLYQLPEAAKVQLLKRATSLRATREEIAAKRAAELARAAGEPAKPAPKKRRVQPRPTQPSQPQAAHTEPIAATAATTANPASGTPPAAPAPAAAGPAQTTAEQEPPPPKPMDDWWLVRDAQGHTGWVLARMVDPDIPLDVMQYAEGQRIQAAFVLNTVQDEEKGPVNQYVMLLNEPHDGIAYDFNQVRVFTWNLKRHRYETAFRAHYVVGYLPVVVSNEEFGREGTMPVFTVRLQNEDGSISPRKYRLIGNIIRPVVAPGEVLPPLAHSPDEPKKTLAGKNSRSKKSTGAAGRKPVRARAVAHHGRKH